MKSYFVPLSLAVVGAAMMLHYKSKAQTDVATLPPVPRTVGHSVIKKPQLISPSGSTEPQVSGGSMSAQQFKINRITAKTKAVFDKPYEFFHNRLVMLNECLEDFNCPFPSRDPKEYEIAVHAEAKTTLQTLSKWQERHHLKDQRMADLMVAFLVFEDAGVKQEALRILATQDTDPQALDPILEHVIEYPQPDGVADGMNILRRYEHKRELKKIDDVFVKVLRTGAVNSAQEIAKNIKPFIHRGNWNRFDDVRDELSRSPLSEEIYASLSEALDR